jgi:hypothetical protein
MNLRNLIARIEKKTKAKFSGAPAYCVHRSPLITFPNNEIEGSVGRCQVALCRKPQLRILVTYPSSPLERKRFLDEARLSFDEMRFDRDRVLTVAQIIEIICAEFQVSRENLLIGKSVEDLSVEDLSVDRI